MASVTLQTSGGLHVDYPISLHQSQFIVRDISGSVTLTQWDSAFYKLESLPSSIRKKRIKNATVNLNADYYSPIQSSYQGAWTDVLANVYKYDENAIRAGMSVHNISASSAKIFANDGYVPLSIVVMARAIMQNSGELCVGVGASLLNFNGSDASTLTISGAPKLTIDYEDAVVTATAKSPSGGWVNRKQPITFSWVPKANGTTIDPVAQASAVISWKVGENGTENKINLSTETQYTIPANTLPEQSDIFWRVQITSDDGVTEPTPEWIKLTTSDSVPVVTAKEPSGSYVSGGDDVKFSWEYNVATGSQQTSYEIQYRPYNEEWTEIASGNTSDHYVIVSSGNFLSGTGEWRIRAANTDGVFSEWSAPLAFIVIAAPQAPAVSVEVSAPRPVISWQSKEQQAFEARIGNYNSGIVYGTEKTYQMPDFLPNGYHEVSVRVLNEFGLWSPWGVSAVDVVNVPGEESIRLGVNAGIDAKLGWTAVQGVSEYWVYRNDERIAKVSGTDYTDRLYLGTASYFVRAVHADGYNYTDSNRATVTLSVDRAMITALDGEWLDIGYSLTSVPNVSVTRSQDVAMMQYNGARLPIPEVSPFEQRTYSISCAFADRQMAARFDELLCRLCCVKDQYGNCMVGMLYSYTRVQNTFTTAYTATLYEVDRSAYEEN